MKVLVTGGSGFIGRHVVERLLRNGHEVVVIDNYSAGKHIIAGTRNHSADIRNRDAVWRVFAKENPDAVCHLAAQASVSKSVRDPIEDAETNILGTMNVADAAALNQCVRIVFASSGGCLYGDVDAPAPETCWLRPASPYGVSKAVGEQYLNWYADTRGLTALSLRLGNVYGPWQRPDGEAGVVAIFCDRLLSGRKPVIHGTGAAVRDYVYVEDVAMAVLLALTAKLPGQAAGRLTPINIGCGRGISVNEVESEVRNAVASCVSKALPEKVHGPNRAGDLQSSILDVRLAERFLGWRPRTQFREGVQATVEWQTKRSMQQGGC